MTRDEEKKFLRDFKKLVKDEKDIVAALSKI